MPWPQFEPITSAPAASNCSAACSGVVPIIVRSLFAPESKIMQATTGSPVSCGGGDGQLGLGQIGHGFDHDPVGPGGGHGLGLLGKGGLQFARLDLAHHQHHAAGPDRGEDLRPGRPAARREISTPDAVDLGHPVGQAMPGEDETVGPEGVGEDDLAAGLDIGPGDLLDRLGMLPGSRRRGRRRTGSPRCCSCVPQAPSVTTGPAARSFSIVGCMVAPRSVCVRNALYIGVLYLGNARGGILDTTPATSEHRPTYSAHCHCRLPISSLAICRYPWPSQPIWVFRGSASAAS